MKTAGSGVEGLRLPFRIERQANDEAVKIWVSGESTEPPNFSLGIGPLATGLPLRLGPMVPRSWEGACNPMVWPR